MDPDHMANRVPNRLCHLSLLNKKQTRGLVHFLGETGSSGKTSRHLSTVYLASFTLTHFDLVAVLLAYHRKVWWVVGA